jgi:hypothetical protein
MREFEFDRWAEIMPDPICTRSGVDAISRTMLVEKLRPRLCLGNGNASHSHADRDAKDSILLDSRGTLSD